jgi:multidrug resistance efflux pump
MSMMPTVVSGKPRSGAKALGILLASSIVITALVLTKSYFESHLALPSPRPAKAAIIAVTPDVSAKKMIRFRGKVFAKYAREVVVSHPGKITDVTVTEGQTVEQGEVLAAYTLDRISMEKVHEILRGEPVLELRSRLYQLRITIDTLKNADLPLHRVRVEQAENELNLLRKLQSRGLAPSDAVTLKERELVGLRKGIQATKDAIKQTEAAFKGVNQDLRFAESHQKRALKLLEWQVGRSYSNPKIPVNRGFLRAPIAGQVIWMNPTFRAGAEVRHLGSSRGPRKGPNLAQVGQIAGMNQLRTEGNGGASQRGFLAMTIAPMRQIVIRALVHELDLVKLKAGDQGTVTFDAFPEKEFWCRILRIPWVSVSTLIEVPATYHVECVVEEPGLMLKEGLTCSVRIPLQERAQPERARASDQTRAGGVARMPTSAIRVTSDRSISSPGHQSRPNEATRQEAAVRY